MYIRRVKSNCGRLIPKAKLCGVQEDEEHNEDALPIQDKIENLQIKISLKERYNRVLIEEFEESHSEAKSLLKDLYAETKELRFHLISAIRSEQTAIQLALRAHRDFQLAILPDRPASFALEWLEDKLFDIAKLLNCYLHKLQSKRKALEDAELMVVQMENSPRPGVLAWEVDAQKEFQRLENKIEDVRIKLETANILHARYNEVRYILRHERGKYEPALRISDDLVYTLHGETLEIQKMLEDAIRFRDQSHKNLTVTEKEASENRKRRKRQMEKMKRAVDKVLFANHSRPPQMIPRKGYFDASREDVAKNLEIKGIVKVKRMEVTKCEERVRHLVEVMRVRDLTHIPIRFRNCMFLGERLQAEQSAKEDQRNLLLRQKDQLYLIMCHFSYSGLASEKEYQSRVQEYKDAVLVAKEDILQARKRLHKYGNIIVNLRLAAIAILDKLDEGKHIYNISQSFYNTIRLIQGKVRLLDTTISNLQKLMTKPSTKNYAAWVKNPPPVARHVRVGTPVIPSSSEEEDFIDMKVPGRADIKAKSKKVIHQGIIRRGFR